ncbi:DUF4136 domain-containing protein [Marinobacter nanhaiticus D15-8W]|uniref:DUF4136 domain-containing protein n=1 Tax=Marinobacter nanhaiticus D15-8W TaxID=626887 RepID=N6WNM1_9GAMM|nr:DUF4136 domain-containing protein [Marinobacter nanhaiticus]ENO13116.1 DUF4136 domain-containing protein [Marinobacter nanhaiticus D15-8W]BES70473.1 DUF4136 domain-containing protein [Marinobacter nanhaiticus D15-8W]
MRYLILVMLLGLVSGCASIVHTDYDAGASFGNYQTWAFAPNEGKSGFLSLDGARVENAIQREMRGESLTQAEPDAADLLVSYRVEDAEKLETRGFTYGFGLGRGNFGFGLSTPPDVREVKQGKLVVELVDRTSERVVWRGVSRRYLDESQSPEDRIELIDEVVTAMFDRYPPS